MATIKKFLHLSIIILSFSTVFFAQDVNGIFNKPILTSVKGTYVLRKGDFSVSLPIDCVSAQFKETPPEQNGGLGTKYSYDWYSPQINFNAQYTDLINKSPANQQHLLQNFRQVAEKLAMQVNGKITAEKDISLKELTGKEIIIEAKDNNFVLRTFVNNGRWFIFYAGSKTLNNPLSTTFLDSFAFVDANKLYENAEQTNFLSKPDKPFKEKSDAQELSLKGKVKSITTKESKSDKLDTSSRPDELNFTQNNFDENGFLLFNLLVGAAKVYAPDNPARELTFIKEFYGFYKGQRATTSGFVYPENYIHPIESQDSTEIFQHSYTYENGLLAEETITSDSGKTNKKVYKYNKNKLEIISSDSKGKQTLNETIYFNDKNEETKIETTYFKGTPNEMRSTKKFQYLEKDDQGNWTKRKTSTEVQVGFSDLSFRNKPAPTEKFELRTIEYYP